MTHNSGSSCFSGITRLLLCKGSLQTHPSDDTMTITNPIPTIDHDILNKGSKNSAFAMAGLNLNTKVEAPVRCTSTTTPGVVARLMGLESLPDPNLVTRSRSVNFMDYYFLDSSDLEQKHRRVRTCVSFREAKINENEHDLFVFSLDDHKVIEKNEKRVKKSENVRQDKNQELQNKKITVERVVLNKNKNGELKTKKVTVERVVLKKNKNQDLKDVKVQPIRKQKVSNNGDRPRTSRFNGRCKGGSPGFVSRVNKKDGVLVKKVKTPVRMINQKEVVVESKFIKKIKNHPCNGNDEFLVHHHLHLSGKKASPKVSNYKVKESTEQKISVTKKEYTEEKVKVESRWTELEDMKESEWMKKREFENIEIEGMCLYFGEQIMDLLVEKLVEELLQH
ncbi:ALC-interacting protein 1 [Euphorbia peplus]|nr:ALC-interacting protein 1 [Euphorbia peplus]